MMRASNTPRTAAHCKQIHEDALGLEYVATELQYCAEKLEGEKHMTDREIMIAYLLLKTKQEDWHGVSDAANDLREMEAREKK